MRRRTYLSAVGASIGLPLGVGGGAVLSQQEPDHDPTRLDPHEFREQLPDPLERRSLKEIRESESEDAGKVLLAVYTSDGLGTQFQFIEKQGPEIIVMMHTTYYYASSMRDAIERLASFFRRVDVEYEEQEETLYITYSIGDYSIRVSQDNSEHRVWVNGDLRRFSKFSEKSKFVNEQVQSRL